jgi:hypothetical protein
MIRFEDGAAAYCAEFKNSHYITVIWAQIGRLCGLRENTWMRHPEELWTCQYDKRLTDGQWLVFVMTFDNMLLPPSMYEEAAAAFERFRVPANRIDHGQAFADAIREFGPGSDAIGLWSTSVTDNPWWVYGPDDGPRPYDLNRDKGHRWITSRRAWRPEQEGDGE